MSRETIYIMLHKVRACLMRQKHQECNGDCKNCMYAVESDKVIEMLDNIIFMYGYVIKKKANKKNFFRRVKK